MQVQFYEEIEDQLLKFAVIISKYQNKWVFCKHKLLVEKLQEKIFSLVL